MHYNRWCISILQFYHLPPDILIVWDFVDCGFRQSYYIIILQTSVNKIKFKLLMDVDAETNSIYITKS